MTVHYMADVRSLVSTNAMRQCLNSYSDYGLLTRVNVIIGRVGSGSLLVSGLL